MSQPENSKTASAMVFQGVGLPLQPRQFALPQLAPQEILVRVLCCTICGSDMHTFCGHRDTPVPTILGHEILGEVVALGPGDPVQGITGQVIEEGQRVTWSVVGNCGDCYFCRQDLPQKCQHLFKYGHRKIQEDHELNGGLADYCHLKAGTRVLAIPDEIPNVVATPANCATATIAAALRTAGSIQGAHVLVLGAGMLGLTASAMASAAGAASVVVADIQQERLDRASQFGADHTVLMDDQSGALAEVVETVTSGRGMDVSLDVCGVADAISCGLESLRIGGTQVLLGSVFPGPPLSLNLESVVRRMLNIRGVHNYIPQDLVAAVEFLHRYHGTYPFADLVTGSYELCQAELAFEAAAESSSLRIAIQPRVE